MSNMDQVVYAPKTALIQRIALTSTGARTALAAAILAMGWIRVHVRGTTAQIVFGDNDDTIPVMDDTTARGYHIADGTYHDFWITGKDTHILHDAAGNGFLDIYRAGQERVRTGT